MVTPVEGLSGYYLYHTRTVFCGTCLGERIGFFRLDSAGNLLPAYLSEDGSDALRAEYSYGCEGLQFDTARNRLLLQLNRDDLSEGWFSVANTDKSLQASWLLREGRFKKERFRYSSRSC